MAVLHFHSSDHQAQPYTMTEECIQHPERGLWDKSLQVLHFDEIWFNKATRNQFGGDLAPFSAKYIALTWQR